MPTPRGAETGGPFDAADTAEQLFGRARDELAGQLVEILIAEAALGVHRNAADERFQPIRPRAG